MRALLLIFLFFQANCNAENDCESIFTEVDSVKAEWRRIDGRKDYCGKTNKNKSPSVINWKNIYNRKLIENVAVICKKRYDGIPLSCSGDTITQIAYANGILIEEGDFFTGYWITGHFPRLMNGLKPGMTFAQVRKIMGTPLFENDCKWQFRCGKNDVVFFFKERMLIAIHYTESQSCD